MGLVLSVIAGGVVVPAAHVLVRDRERELCVRLGIERDLVEPVFQDRQDASSRRSVDRQRARTGGLDPVDRVALRVADQREA